MIKLETSHKVQWRSEILRSLVKRAGGKMSVSHKLHPEKVQSEDEVKMLPVKQSRESRRAEGLHRETR
jgi:hypothetical protein